MQMQTQMQGFTATATAIAVELRTKSLLKASKLPSLISAVLLLHSGSDWLLKCAVIPARGLYSCHWFVLADRVGIVRRVCSGSGYGKTRNV
jgi:hypothetical protein